jgi:hypothetical protein
MMPDKNTDLRVTAQPITEERLENLRGDIEDSGVAAIGGPLTRAEAAAICGDAMHWRAMYQDGLEANVELAREVKRRPSPRASGAAVCAG